MKYLALLLLSGCVQVTLVLPGAVVNQYDITKTPIILGDHANWSEDIDLSDLGKGNSQQGGETELKAK